MSVRLANPMSAVVWLAFFLPAALFGGWLDRAFGVAVFVLGGAVLISKPSPWEARKPSARALRIFLLIEFLYVFSFLYSAAFNGVQFGLGDYFEILRYVLLGTFVVYLIRHYDARVRGAMDWAMTAALYAALLFPAVDPQGYAALLTMCYLLFFSRLRLRFLHAATALVVVFFSGALSSWTASLFVLSAALAVGLYRLLARRRKKFAVSLSLAVYLLLLTGAAVCVRLKPGAAAGVPAAAPPRQAARLIGRSPIFGWGPVEDQEVSSAGNQYVLWLLKSGALGTGVILLGLIFVGYGLLSAASADVVHLAGAAAFIGSLAMMLAAGPFLESFQHFFLTAFFVAGIHQAKR
jgi:hypothetical protein